METKYNVGQTIYLKDYQGIHEEKINRIEIDKDRLIIYKLYNHPNSYFTENLLENREVFPKYNKKDKVYYINANNDIVSRYIIGIKVEQEKFYYNIHTTHDPNWKNEDELYKSYEEAEKECVKEIDLKDGFIHVFQGILSKEYYFVYWDSIRGYFDVSTDPEINFHISTFANNYATNYIGRLENKEIAWKKWKIKGI